MTYQATVKADLALDQQIAQGYVKYLVDHDRADDYQARQDYCAAAGVHPKLLYSNPHVKSIASLFGRQSNFERLMEMSLRDYLAYHYTHIHQGYRYGAKDLQQKWLGRDLIKTPMDCWIYQEIIHATRPDVILELGVMFGGATAFYASMLDLVGHGEVIGVDVSLAKVDVSHPRISWHEGSSISQETFDALAPRLRGKNVLVIADSDHEKIHVLNEIRRYQQFVPVGGYFIVEDSLNDPMHFHPVPNEGPQAAAMEFLQENQDFIPDLRWAERYVMSLNPYGYLKRIR